MSHIIPDHDNKRTLVICQPDSVGNKRLHALVTVDDVFINGGDSETERYISLVLTVADLDAIRTEMAKLEGVH